MEKCQFMSTGASPVAVSPSSWWVWVKILPSPAPIAEASIWRKSWRQHLFWMVARIEGREVPVAVEKNDVRHPHAPLEGFAGEISNY